MRYIWIRFRRSPLSAAAVFLFSGLIALALCSLQRGIFAAQEHYDEIYRQIRVRCTVTNLTGDQSDYLNIPPQLHTLFTEGSSSGSFGFEELVEDLWIKSSLKFDWEGEEYTLAGITTLQAEARLWPENGCVIFWEEDADDSVFAGEELKCMISGELMKELQKRELSEDFFALHLAAEDSYGKDYDGELEIVGTYEGDEKKTVYCPWETYLEICRSSVRAAMADSLSATLKDNDELETLRERAEKWFAKPDVKMFGLAESEGFYLALDINDVQLEQAKQNLKNSIAVNRTAAAAIFVLSAGAGALVGFLIIRSRKHEIALQWTLGTTNGEIYRAYAAEQALCVILGTAAGGAIFRWSPPYQLCLFAGVYLAGLSVMLWIYLRKNLITVMKEEE
ncbi:MAG: hypothetical protein NC541_13410 [bacterium]|nr:hypothetical protein [bacterium]